MSNVKMEILRILDDMHWKIEQTELELRNKISQLEENNLKTHKFITDNRKVWFKKIVAFMSTGLTYRQAVQLLCEEEKFDRNRIEYVFSVFDYEKKATELYAKIYAIKKLKAADFTNKKIAEILNISALTVAKLLKCKLTI